MITVTDGAALEIIRQAEAKGYSPSLRIAVRGGGCSGFSYALEWGAEAIGDHVFEHAGAKVLVDPKSLIYLSGSTVEFEKSLMQRGFKITNPGEKSRCGCGESIEF